MVAPAAPKAGENAWAWRALWLLPLFYWTWRFWPALAQGRLLFGSDTASLGLPQEIAARRIWDQGQWPHWLPDLLGGMPGIGGLNLNFLYPTFLASALLGLPPAQAFGLDAWLHILLSTLGAGWLGRHLGLSRGAALMAGLAYGASGSQVSLCFAGHANNLRAIAFIPWVLGFWAWFWDAPGAARRRLAAGLCGLGLGLQALGGGLQILAYTLPVLLAFALWLAWSRPQPRALPRVVLGLGVAAVLALMISAPLLLPAWQHQGQSAHEHLTYQEFTSWSFPPAEALQWFRPAAFGWQSPDYHGAWDFNFTHEYLGLLPWVLALLGLWAARRSKHSAAWFLGTLSLVAFVVALGKYTPLHQLFYRLPIYQGFRAWTRALCFLTLGLSLLAGLGWQALQDRLPRAAILPLLVIVLGLHLLDLQQVHSRYVVFSDADAYSRAPAFLQALPPQDVADPFRVHVDLGLQSPNGVELSGHESEGGYQALPLLGPQGLRRALKDKVLGFYALMNVRYLVQKDPVQAPMLKDLGVVGGASIYENRLNLPRARWAKDSISASSAQDAWDILARADMDYSKTVVVEGASRVAQTDPKAQVAWSQMKAMAWDLQATSEKGGLLVLSQAWYPNWKARVDGQDVPILRAYGAIQALELGPGEHKIELRYVDHRFRLGAWACALSLVLLSWLGLAAWRERSV